MSRHERIPISKNILDELNAHKQRTNIGETALLGGKRGSLPKGLNGATAQNIMRGLVSTARKDHIDCMLELWEATPDNARPRKN